MKQNLSRQPFAFVKIAGVVEGVAVESAAMPLPLGVFRNFHKKQNPRKAEFRISRRIS
jgi:hypothetical protein